MEIAFEKWHGCHNDFVVVQIDARQTLQYDALCKAAKSWCQRDGGGIGADGLIIMRRDVNDTNLRAVQLTIINSDGSLAQTCGNGIRVAAASIAKSFHVSAKKMDRLEGVTFNLPERSVSVQYLDLVNMDRPFVAPLTAVNMGSAKFNDDTADYAAAVKTVGALQQTMKSRLDIMDIAVADIGNPHLVLFTRSGNVDKKEFFQFAEALQSEYLFRDGVNVHLVETLECKKTDFAKERQRLKINVDEYYRALVWERGAGPTQACGSGACAIAGAALLGGFIDRESWIPVVMPGGNLLVKRDAEDSDFLLAGPSQFVFAGKIEI